VRRKFFAAEALLIALAIGCSTAAAAADRLPGYAAETATFTVSGVSAGGYMAVQMHIAHSSRITGVGALAAGPYYCAQGSISTAVNNCMTPGAWSPLPSAAVVKGHVERFAMEKRIDPPGYLARGRAWLFSGTQDSTVKPEVVDALARLYGAFNTKLVVVNDKPAGHAMVTHDAGNACGASEPPFINDCDYDAAGELLRYVLGGLSPPPAQPQGRLITFDQKAFAAGNAYAISMADDGYAYVPSVCETERCRVHVAFHGCRQGAAVVGERFVREAGYNRWADTNRLIVLYPQVIARYWWIYNPRGCWDWWGYTGTHYATREGTQLRAVMAMVERLSAARK
jgi:poly(3-hydroxybutyrate) depolymerase